MAHARPADRRRARTPSRSTSLGVRVRRFLVDVVLQRRTIRERPVAGLAHAFVFWGFVAFGGYTLVEFLHGLGIVDLTDTRLVPTPTASRSTPFAVAVLAGILYLLVRRAFVRPVALGTKVSIESIVIALFIATLMVTFLLDLAARRGVAGGPGELVGARARHPRVPRADPGVEALSPGAVAGHRVPEVARARQRAEPRFREGAGRPRDGEGPRQQDGARRVHLRRVRPLPGELSGVGRRQGAEPEDDHPADAGGAARRRSATRSSARSTREKVLWQCTTCGACENQCPVGIEHLPLIIGARRGLVSNGDAPEYLGGVYNNLERRSNIWGLELRPAAEVRRVGRRSRSSIRARHDVLVWLGCAGAFEADFQKSLRSLFEILRAQQRDVRRAVEGALHRRSGEADRQRVHVPGAGERRTSRISRPPARRRSSTSCPHCVKTIGDDYRQVRLRGRDRALVGVRRGAARATSRAAAATAAARSRFTTRVISGATPARSTSRARCSTRFGADVKEPVRNRDNPYCCGAGGGLLFADKEEEPGSRISDVRFKQLQDDRRRHRRDRLPVLLDHAEGRAGERARRRHRSSSI